MRLRVMILACLGLAGCRRDEPPAPLQPATIPPPAPIVERVPPPPPPAPPPRPALSGDPALPGFGAGDPKAVAALAEATARRGGGAHKYTNRLIFETSPYLLQHAHNPVSWYPWGDPAFERARREGKPVLLSIGYATCHWCHVMEEESFEDPEIAEALNRGFVAVKVDREERPDVDDVYMTAVQTLSGRGGWPMTLLLTPEREPFFAATYLPPRDGARGARKGLLTVLRELKSEWDSQREAVVARARDLSRRVREASAPDVPAAVPGPEALVRAAQTLARAFDAANGGFGRAPKFPQPSTLALLLRHHRRTGDPGALRIVVRTLEAMARGGIRDQLGGGFHRYATDAGWLIPHFEIMLYDQAQLVTLYLDAWRVTGRKDFADVAREVLDATARDLRLPDGTFAAALDADSPDPSGKREEGRSYTWTPAELEGVLGPDAGRAAAAAFGVTPGGHVDGRSVLSVHGPVDASVRSALLASRARRPPPPRDDAVITAWNGLMISAFARSARALGRPGDLAIATAAADRILAALRGPDGRLYRSLSGGEPRGAGTLEDYAAFEAACIDLYEATSQLRWLEVALDLQRTLDARFPDATAGGYFRTADDAEKLLARDKPAYDGAEPSGNAMAAMNLLRLGNLTLDDAFVRRADALLGAFATAMSRGGFGQTALLAALEWRLDRAVEVVIVGAPGDTNTADLARRAAGVYAPNASLLVMAPGDVAAQAKRVPGLDGKVMIGGRPTAFVCERGACQRPTSDPEELARQLAVVTPLVQATVPPLNVP